MSESLTKQLQEFISQFNSPLAKNIESAVVSNGRAIITISTNPAHHENIENLQKQLIQAVESGCKLNSVSVVYTQEALPKVEKTDKRQPIVGVKKVLMVASGKGGVGKSTVAANIAGTLAEMGYKVGLVDADIYGPSLPKLFGLSARPALENNLAIPLEKYGIKLMSVGFLVEGDAALVWRGPMTSKMLYQLIRMTNWAHDGVQLDYLIVDTPPGTGDVHLSLAENYVVDGVVLVTTPQDLATVDVVKGIDMFKKVNIPIIGVVENMSYYEDSNGKCVYLFGKDGGKNLAQKYNLKLLAEIPLMTEFSDLSAKGKLAPCIDENAKISKIYRDLVEELVLKMQAL